MTRSADGDLRIDSVLRDTYKIVSVLGRGGMGSVFLAQHLRLPGKQVAIKVLRGDENLGPGVHARFRREAEIASRLGHPNIVEVLDYDTLEDGSPFLVLEYLRGESLADRIRRGRMPLEEVFSFVRQMGSALHTAHRAGIVHRDLKPANVFLVPTDSGGVVGEHVKLLDFGISKVLSSETLLTQDSVLMGTPQYMSPEQAQGRNSEIDARTDVFALGCIVFEMLSGTSPFRGDSMAHVIYRIVHEPPASLAALVPELPAHVVDAVERALAKSREARYPDVASFVGDLTGSPLQSLPALDAGGMARSGTSGLAGAPQPSSVGVAPAGTARFGEVPAGGDTMGLGATVASGNAVKPSPPVAPVAAVEPTPPTVPLPVEAVAPASKQPPASSGALSRGLLVAGALGLLAGAVGIGWALRSEAPPPMAPPAVVENTPPAEARLEPTAQAPAPVPPEAEPRAEAPALPEEPVADTKPAVSRPARAVVAEPIPEAVRRLLKEGEAALEGGNPDEALRLARRSQRTKRTSAAQALITRAYCRKKDLGGAIGAVKGVAAAERPGVKRYCRKYEIEL